MTVTRSGKSSSKQCFRHISNFLLENKLEILQIHQLDDRSIEMAWKSDESIESEIQIQYRLMHVKSPWNVVNQFYNNSINHAIISDLQNEQTYRFRLLAFDPHGQQIMSSSIKRFTLKSLNHLPIPQITDAWITNEGQISLKWKLNDSNPELIDGFLIYYRLLNVADSNNFTKITIPNVRYPLIDTYTITSIQFDRKYEIRMSTYSNKAVSPMSNAIEISIPPRKFSAVQQTKRKGIDQSMRFFSLI